jgi:hypothetical protein
MKDEKSETCRSLTYKEEDETMKKDSAFRRKMYMKKAQTK